MDTIRSLGGRKRLQVRITSTCPFLAHRCRYCAATECRLLGVERKSLLRLGGVVVWSYP